QSTTKNRPRSRTSSSHLSQAGVGTVSAPETTPLRSVTAGPEPIPTSPSPPGSGSGGKSNLALHAQIRHLQRQLEARTEEVKQLRRLLDAKQDAGVSEQLRQTERESRMWRERAEAAERRVGMFERLVAAGMKRRKMLMQELGEGGKEPSQDKDDSKEREDDGGAATPGGMDGPNDPARKKTRQRSPAGQRSRILSSAEHTEDEVVVNSRIRMTLRAMGGHNDSGEEEDGDFDEAGVDKTGLDEEDPSTVAAMECLMSAQKHTHYYNTPNNNSERSTSDGGGTLSASAASMWMAAEQLLQLHSPDDSVSNKYVAGRVVEG
ncbi:hypothetical protein B0H63DRAFT_240250, partial [Podospora didyma]